MRKAGIFVSLVVLARVVFTVGGYWAGLPNWSRTVIKSILPCLLLVAGLVCRGSEAGGQWRCVFLALFTASSACWIHPWYDA